MASPPLHGWVCNTLVVCFFLLLLSPLSSSSTTSLRNANRAVCAASESAGDAAGYVSRLLRTTARKSAALKDCKELLSDSVDLLNNTAGQLRRLRPENFAWQMDNALTWASAALTNQDTCLQGLQEAKAGISAKARRAVITRVSRASRFTSNALRLINSVASNGPRI